MNSRWSLPLLLAASLIAQDWEIALPGYTFRFPRDYFSHPAYQTEWWYYTGNLRAQDGHRYGFELTFFRQGVHLPPQVAGSEDTVWRPDQLYLAHLALSDIDGHSFYNTERLNRAGPGLAGASMQDGRYWNGNWQVRWTSLPDSQQELVAVSNRFTLHLTLQPRKPPVIQGQNGVSQKGPARGQASHYISFTRLAAAGELNIKASVARVSGIAWMDHEFFSEPPDSNLAGWDWFAIQLDNNEELMIYRLRDKSRKPNPYSSGSYTDAAGQVHFLDASAFSMNPGTTWESPHSKARYPISWQIAVPSLDLQLEEQTDLQDQELSGNETDSPVYWEGAVRYKGTLRKQPIAGVGYLEMTGYREAIRLSGMAAK